MAPSLDKYIDLSAPYDQPVVQSVKLTPKPQRPIEEIAEFWLDHFDKAIALRKPEAVTALFHSDGNALSHPANTRVVEGRSRAFMGPISNHSHHEGNRIDVD
jgi:hypothetical protein